MSKGNYSARKVATPGSFVGDIDYSDSENGSDEHKTKSKDKPEGTKEGSQNEADGELETVSKNYSEDEGGSEDTSVSSVGG